MDESKLRDAVFQVRGISKVYKMGEVAVYALRSVDLNLCRGEFAVLLGAIGGRAKAQKVEIGHRSSSFAHVPAGLAEGESVILHPPNNVADETRIQAN